MDDLFTQIEEQPPVEERAYQTRAVDDLRDAVRRGKRRPLLCMPTGSGKTVVAKRIVDGAVEKRKSVVALAPRREDRLLGEREAL